MLRIIVTSVVMLGVAGAACPLAADPSNKPTRIVSLNLCADQLLLRLAGRPNIASVTWLSRDPNNSNVAELAAQVPVNHGLAEEVIPLRPDLVIAGVYTTRAAVALLKRVGIPVMELGVPRNLDEVRAQIRDMAQAVGERDAGERIIGEVDQRLAVLPPASPPSGPRAIMLNPNGITVGADTLVDEIMTRAGLTNLATRLGVDRNGRIPLEIVVRGGVDVLILNAGREGPPSLATEILHHPALTALSGRVRLVVLPSRLWVCGGPEVVEATERLARVANDLRAAGATQ